MILTPRPLQKPAPRGVVTRPLRAATPTWAATSSRPVLQSSPRVPQQLCLDLQPRLR